MSRLTRILYRRFGHPRAAKTFEWERAVAEREGMVRAGQGSPPRFEIIEETLGDRYPPAVLRAAPQIAGSILGIQESLQSIEENPDNPSTTAPDGFLGTVESRAKALGISSIGYAQVPRKLIFQGKAIAYANAIVLAMEMDWQRMELAPHPQTAAMVMGTYNRLGRVANRLAGFLRRHGFGAHAGHPLMGLVLYPPLAWLAGMGWQGYHGLLITPEHGPRVRLAALFTSIENLPRIEASAHTWVADFCACCRRCIRECPAEAILEEPIVHPSGRLTYTLDEPCFRYFSENYGCSVCIKVCPFNRASYESLRSSFQGEAPVVRSNAVVVTERR